MRTNSETFSTFNQSTSKEIRLVVKLGFATPVYITSHDDIVISGEDVLSGFLKKTNATSQKLNPLEARSEIGSIGFEVVDVGGAFSDKLREKDALEEGLKGLLVGVYLGGAGMSFADFRIEQTQIIDKPVLFDGGTYRFNCRDIHREMRKDIFDFASTRASADFLTSATSLNVLDSSDFEACTHGSEWGLNPNESIYYLRITTNDVFEIVSATTLTGTVFSGITRGLFGTDEIDHAIPAEGASPTTGPKVEELVYLEGTAPHLAYQLLTGKNFSSTQTLPSSWHLGIDETLVDKTQFENIGTDLHDPSDPLKGFLIRGDGLTKEDGKRFIEKEVCLPMGCFPTIGADGRIGLKRATSVLSTAGTVKTLDETNVIKAYNFQHDLNDIKNVLDIKWSYISTNNNQKADYYRRNALLDPPSQTKNGTTRHSMKFKMLHNERHTQNTLNSIFNGLRDRHSGPPVKLSLDLLPSLNDLEVGDIVRVNLTHLRDFQGPANLDRSMEVQNISFDQVSGKVTVQVFGSTNQAAPIANGGGASFELPDGWYSAEGTDIETLSGISIGEGGFLNADFTIDGGANLTSPVIIYHLGDLTINAGVTLTLTRNIWLRVMGQLQVNGTITTAGQGEPPLVASDFGIPGYIGPCISGGGHYIGGPNNELISGGKITNGEVTEIPSLAITNDAGVFSGIPSNLMGTSSAKGDPSTEWTGFSYVQKNAGRLGGAGGGGLVITARGMGFGSNGELDLSGADGLAGQQSFEGTFLAHSGSGGGGAPGAAILMIDTNGSSAFPIVAGNVKARFGLSPDSNAGKGGDTLDSSAVLAMYVPASENSYP